MRIYLDTCCYNRPYDKTLQLQVILEAACKLQIQELAKDNKLELVSSYMLFYECSKIPNPVIRNNIENYIKKYAVIHIQSENKEKIEASAETIMKTGIKFKDACHVASAIYAKCDYFISTDKRLLKFKSSQIELLSPIEFLLRMEDK